MDKEYPDSPRPDLFSRTVRSAWMGRFQSYSVTADQILRMRGLRSPNDVLDRLERLLILQTAVENGILSPETALTLWIRNVSGKSLLDAIREGDWGNAEHDELSDLPLCP